MNEPITRRELLKLAAAVAGSIGLIGLQRSIDEPNDPATVYLPIIARPSIGPKVVHVHAPGATSWNFSTGWYGDYVNQNQVNNMVDRSVRELTGQSTAAAAWNALLPGYAPGKGIAIKVNFNNAECSDTGNMIDGLAEPVNALIKGMKSMGVREQDIWIYDAVRTIPTRFRNHCVYPNVHMIDNGWCGGVPATFNSNDPNASVRFANSKLGPRHIADVLIEATYLINMPIVKAHAIAGKTLGFKNHFGTIKYVVGSGDDNLHAFISPGNSEFSSTYNPMVEIYLNPHIRNKTVLTVGDALYGCLLGGVPAPWQTFGNAAPNSLFFATDPVAIDCVMMDILSAEPMYQPYPGTEDYYLKLAAAAGLGTFERGSPWGAGYHKIGYSRIELS